MTGIIAIVLAFFAGAFAQGGNFTPHEAPAPVATQAPAPRPTIIDDEPNFDTEGDGPDCEGDMIVAEDGSCVNADFYSDMPENYTPDLTFGAPPCEFEDSAGPCYWDASERGNGTGQDFFVSADGTVTYWNN